MGSFSDAVDNDLREQAKYRQRCQAIKVGDAMDDDDRKLYLSLLERPVAEVGHLWLRNRLIDAGITAPCVSSIRRHRSQQCLCVGFHHRTGN